MQTEATTRTTGSHPRHLIILSKPPASFKSEIQSHTAMPTEEMELVASVLTMKEAVFCSNRMKGLEFEHQFGRLPLYIDSTATLHVLGNQAFSSRTKHIAPRYSYVGELVTEGSTTIHYISTDHQRISELSSRISIVFAS